MKRRYGFCLVFFLSTYLSASVAESVHPLSSPTDSKQDERLFGAWRGRGEHANIYLHFGRVTNGRTEILVVEHESNGRLDVSNYIMFPREADSHSYMDAQSIHPEHGKSGFVFVKYSIDKARKKLALWLMDDDKVREAIENGTLGGHVKTGRFGSRVELTDATPRLAEFIRDDHEHLFTSLGVFNRVASR